MLIEKYMVCNENNSKWLFNYWVKTIWLIQWSLRRHYLHCFHFLVSSRSSLISSFAECKSIRQKNPLPKRHFAKSSTYNSTKFENCWGTSGAGYGGLWSLEGRFDNFLNNDFKFNLISKTNLILNSTSISFLKSHTQIDVIWKLKSKSNKKKKKVKWIWMKFDWNQRQNQHEIDFVDFDFDFQVYFETNFFEF